MPTMRDVADQAKVSISTVSHVINNTRFVDPETRLRVVSAIETLGYRPNSVARSLRRRETATLGLLVPDAANPFFAEAARAVEDAGFAEGYSVILCNSDGSEEKEVTYLNVLLSKQVDGLILMSLGSSLNALQLALDADVPVIVVDRELDDARADQILIDNEQGGNLAGQYLTKLGHRQIACICGPTTLALGVGRLKGFRRALEEARVSLPPEAIAYGDFQYSSGETAMQTLLTRDLKFTALFAANDMMAFGAISVLNRSGLRVPDDVSVIGFDDIPLSQGWLPSLTTIAQPTPDLGRLSIQALLARIRSPSKPRIRIILPTRLVERASCRPLR
jgi:LacI family transcriptional regulator